MRGWLGEWGPTDPQMMWGSERSDPGVSLCCHLPTLATSAECSRLNGLGLWFGQKPWRGVS